MGPKKENEDLKKDDSVIAVVIADSYQVRFGPLTTDKPKCLLPLANRPLLGYTLESLKNSGVQEVFVYCTSHADQIKHYLQNSEWGTKWCTNAMTITPITNEDCCSFGDAMRDLDAKGLLRQDFILVFGDSINNANLSSILEDHKKRSKEDKNAIMTMVYKKCDPGHHCRTMEDELVIATNNEKRILFHTKFDQNSLKVPLEIFEEHDNVNICFDLLDPGVAICTQAVPPLFADNVDYQTLDEFVKGVLENDLLDNTFYYHELREEYAARVTNFHQYNAVTRDVLNRWMFPIVPDLGLGNKKSPYKYSRHNIYKCHDDILGRGSVLEEDVIVGPGCKIGENSTLRKVSLGANCKIGKNVVLDNCIIHDNAVIGDDSKLLQCVLGEGTVLGKTVEVGMKSVLGAGVEISTGAKLPAETRLVAQPQSDESGFSDDENDDDLGSDLKTDFGPKAFRFVDQEDSDSDDEKSLVEDMWGLSLQTDDDDDDASSEDSDDDDFEGAMTDILLNEDSKLNTFHTEVMESLLRGANEGLKSENLILEINSSKHAYAVTLSQVNDSVISCLMNIPLQRDESLSGVKLLGEIKKCFKQFHELMLNYIKTPSAQLDCLLALETQCEKNQEKFLPIVMKIVHHLYEADVLAESVIVSWYNSEPTSEEFGPVMRQKIEAFIQWLEEADSESDEESD